MANRFHEDGREVWSVGAPRGGWGEPWPQCIELARELSAQHWSLVGGLMVQLHAARAGLAVSRPTQDVDIVLHVETGKTTASTVMGALGTLAVLAARMQEPLRAQRQMKGKDRSRIQGLRAVLGDSSHRSWFLLETEDRHRAQLALEALASNPQKHEFRSFGQR